MDGPAVPLPHWRMMLGRGWMSPDLLERGNVPGSVKLGLETPSQR
jgi:hypothetical protein